MRGVINRRNPPAVSVRRAWHQAMHAALVVGDMKRVVWLLSAAAGLPRCWTEVN